MASYFYKCGECEFVKEVNHSMKESPEIMCDECSHTMGKMIPRNFNFMLKGTNWSGKNLKEKSYRASRQKEMGRRMAQKHDIPQIQPNYKGEVCDSWDTAKKLAREDGVDTNRYEKQVENLKNNERKVKEKRTKLLRGEA